MSFIEDTLAAVPFPKIVKVEQRFDSSHIEPKDMERYVLDQLVRLQGFTGIKPGQRIALTGGSRAFDGLVPVTRAVADAVRGRGAEPFLVPAMGSHGGATAEGQRAMLEDLGMTEEAVHAPILSSMEVDRIGEVLDGRPVFLDRYANRADGIILINRIKCHTSFRGRYESGLMKMMAIGLGKQEGAQHYHQTGLGTMAQAVEAVGNEVLRLKNILFGVGIIENGFGKAADIVCMERRDIPAREAQLLVKANGYLPRMFCKKLDVLGIQKIGKDVSGTGMDTNVVGRFPGNPENVDVHIKRIVILDLTDVSHGNANGMGRADFITQRLYDKIKPDQFYPNALTSTAVESARIPIVLPSDRLSIAAAVKTSTLADFKQARLALIESTKNMFVFYVSENMLEEARAHGALIRSEPFEIPFDEKGALLLEYK